ncbi:MAG: hypothetical protein GVY18_03205 [Bacteroidetes bacterium]|jgi:hypothetical protein|nr:hypothetical protein [Bacteroidota bacterium]
MSDSLIDILARDYGLDADEAADLLETLGRRLREQAEAGETVVLPHVGAIENVNDQLTLAPREDVLDALTRRHGDLTEIQLSVPAPPAVEEGSAEAESATGLEFAPTPSGPSTPEAPPAEPSSPPEPEAAETAEPALPPSPRRSHQRAPEPRPAGDGRIWWAVLLVLALLIVGATLTFIFVYDGSLANLPFAVPGVTEQTASQDPAPSAAPDTTQALLPVDPATADTATATTDEPASAPPAIEAAAGGWTIIVGAFPSRAEADSMLGVFRSRLADTQAPVDTLTAPAEATRFRFRVAVGQYETQADANAARRTLGDQLPGDAWILRLQ